MDNFTSSSSSSSSPLPPLSDNPPTSAPSSSAAFDDGSEDSCSICLEPFSTDDPATITSCKHEYHLHCILEWSQRSKECPICWQLLVLKDPANQKLLAVVEAERLLRSRSSYSSAFPSSRIPLERLNVEHDDSCSDDSDFDEQIMHHLVAAANRAHYIRRRERQRSSGAGPSEVPVFDSSVLVSGLQPPITTSSSGGSSPASGVMFDADIQPPASALSPVDLDARNSTPETDFPFKARVLYSEPPSEGVRRLNTSEMFSFPESIKSKFSAASARYKESISKSTRGLKEKLLARNASVKELSKGVQREMNAGIAGVARMIERLDLASKRATTPMPSFTGGTSGFPLRGKTVQENGSGQSLHFPVQENSIEQSLGAEGNVEICDVSSDAALQVSSTAITRIEVPQPCIQVQSGHDAVKT